MSRLIHGDRICKGAKVLVGASAQIWDPSGKQILLTKRGDNGRWCLPGGQLDSGESIKETCAREVLEETGLIVDVGHLIAVYTNPDMLLSYDKEHQYQMVSFHFAVTVTGGEVGLSDETTDVGFFSLEEIKEMDLMEHHQQRIEDALLGKKETLVR
ncbi:MAG: NUDIX domain-containing protein [Anaerolineales bacterium]|nr:NUDIX domain-containing protein [Anaerolineales bacterium]